MTRQTPGDLIIGAVLLTSATTATTTTGARITTGSLPDGEFLILRDLFVNEEVFRWSDVCEYEGLPHCYTLALVIHPDLTSKHEARRLTTSACG